MKESDGQVRRQHIDKGRRGEKRLFLAIVRYFTFGFELSRLLLTFGKWLLARVLEIEHIIIDN